MNEKVKKFNKKYEKVISYVNKYIPDGGIRYRFILIIDDLVCFLMEGHPDYVE